MIYSLEKYKKTKYFSELISYITEKYNYQGENLIYSKKYSNGTFSITKPASEFENCDYINGYPHFSIPLDVCLCEISNFISKKPIYDSTFLFRYGDTHPHKAVPKLSQVRNLYIDDILSSMVLTSNNKKDIYAFGNISEDSIRDFLKKYGLFNDELCEKMFFDIFNGNLKQNQFCELFKEYTDKSFEKVKKFINIINISEKSYLYESDIYYNQEIYRAIRNNKMYGSELKSTGELKYSLQELMFILSVCEEQNKFIAIIGDNQTEHVRKVMNLLSSRDDNLDVKYLTYGICKNGESREITDWSEKIEEFIDKNNLIVNNEKLEYYDFLRLIVLTLNNDNIIDYSDLNKYLKNYMFLNKMNNTYLEVSKSRKICDLSNSNDLINMMSLVNYTLNKSIELGEQSLFFRYVFQIVNEYNDNSSKYENISGLFHDFLQTSMEIMTLNNITKKTKTLQKQNNKGEHI